MSKLFTFDNTEFLKNYLAENGYMGDYGLDEWEMVTKRDIIEIATDEVTGILTYDGIDVICVHSVEGIVGWDSGEIDAVLIEGVVDTLNNSFIFEIFFTGEERDTAVKFIDEWYVHEFTDVELANEFLESYDKTYTELPAE